MFKWGRRRQFKENVYTSVYEGACFEFHWGCRIGLQKTDLWSFGKSDFGAGLGSVPLVGLGYEDVGLIFHSHTDENDTRPTQDQINIENIYYFDRKRTVGFDGILSILKAQYDTQARNERK